MIFSFFVYLLLFNKDLYFLFFINLLVYLVEFVDGFKDVNDCEGVV